MSTRAIIWTIVVVVVVLLGAWYFWGMGSTQPAGTSTTATSTEATSTASGGTQTTLRALASQSGNYTCTIENIQSQGPSTTGTVYGAGGKTRLDFAVTQNGVTTNMHIIRSGTTSYTWVDGQTTGIKATISASSPIATPGQGGVIAVNDTTNISSTCHPWLPDQTQFVPPKGITFVAR